MFHSHSAKAFLAFMGVYLTEIFAGVPGMYPGCIICLIYRGIFRLFNFGGTAWGLSKKKLQEKLAINDSEADLLFC
jgi:hypothetical protein